ncbi:TPA: DUF3797 domain-containing protein [Acinetobacter baumannii]|nr:DUF3797 domain-containing protein [Acinetobacter baumannii]MBP4169332.1 DUF3797 domain-containing protein [Acinetobacter baumannii]MBP4169335.1 DUF3797 domain-containing protein [Acinetobacter baumannii]MBP4221525.1 DUF3797 domain-containing protein [Acinetobacter baumannii]MBP4306307.1 DUF3797 domain-containing protein [Acinetobacter baumannii]
MKKVIPTNGKFCLTVQCKNDRINNTNMKVSTITLERNVLA